MKLRLNLNAKGAIQDPANIKEVVLVPFDQLTVEEHVRIFERDAEDEGGTPLLTARNRLARVLGIETRWVSVMSMAEVDDAFTFVQGWYDQNNGLRERMAKVHETLEDFENAHERPFNSKDVAAVMADFQLFRDSLTVDGRTFRAPHNIEAESCFGQWIDLQEAMTVEQPESEAYIRALAIMMVEDGGEAWPSDAEALRAFIVDRTALFRKAAFVDALGCAAFFFSRSERFAVLCGFRMTRFQSLLRPASEPTSRVIPSDSALTQSLEQALGTSPN